MIVLAIAVVLALCAVLAIARKGNADLDSARQNFDNDLFEGNEE